jgi:hypothetical protein
MKTIFLIFNRITPEAVAICDEGISEGNRELMKNYKLGTMI